MNEETVQKVVTKEIGWLKTHERLVIVLLFIILIGFLGNKYVNYAADKAGKDNAVAQAALKEQHDTNQALATQTTQILSLLAEKNQKLNTAIVTRNNDLGKAQEAIKTLPVPVLASRWAELAVLNENDLQVTQNGITVSDNGIRQTVTQLERIPVLVSNINDKDNIINNKDSAINSLTKQADGCKLELSLKDTACKKEADQLKADATKGKVRWFKIGFVTGFVSGVLTARALP